MLLPLTTCGHGQSIGVAPHADRISGQDRRLQARGPMEGFACQGTPYDSPSRIAKAIAQQATWRRQYKRAIANADESEAADMCGAPAQVCFGHPDIRRKGRGCGRSRLDFGPIAMISVKGEQSGRQQWIFNLGMSEFYAASQQVRCDSFR